MPRRITPLVNDLFYHVYNRGVEKRRIFSNVRDFQRFLKTAEYYQFLGPKPKFSKFSKDKNLRLDLNDKIIEIIAYCLMPNHFHFLLKQVQDGGISEFLSKLSNSYTKYYNTKNQRVGPLLQGEFKAVLVESDKQLMHLSRYIHLNPHTSHLIRKIDDWEWSSLPEYINGKNGICAKSEVLNLFKSPEEYQQFIQDRADFLQSIEVIYPQLIDDDLA